MAQRGRRALRPPRHRASVIGVLGEIILSSGVLILLFIGWQLWFDDLVSTNDQELVAQELTEMWAENPPTPNSGDVTPNNGEQVPSVAVPVLNAPQGGSQFAVLHIPRFGDDYLRPILSGVGLDLLAKGLGYYPETQLPGEVGNFALAGHRTTKGSPFNGIADLRIGDAIVVETAEGWFTYRFRNLEYVLPSGVGVIAPVPQNESLSAEDRLLTMTSCNPMFYATERIVAYSVFDSFTPRADGAPASLKLPEDT